MKAVSNEAAVFAVGLRFDGPPKANFTDGVKHSARDIVTKI